MTNDETTNEDPTTRGVPERSDHYDDNGLAALRPAVSLRRLQPEARLALAVLEDAVHTLRATRGVDGVRARSLAAEAWRWIACDDVRHAFGFRWICHHLDLDPEWLRRGLAAWRPAMPAVTPRLTVLPRRRGAA